MTTTTKTGLCWVCGLSYDHNGKAQHYCSAKCAEVARDELAQLWQSAYQPPRRIKYLTQQLQDWDNRTEEPFNVRQHSYDRPKGWR